MNLNFLSKHKPYNLFLDDDCETTRDPHGSHMASISKDYTDNEWVTAKKYDEFVAIIEKNGLPELVSFDHDISDFDDNGNEKTGYDCAKWLVEYCDRHKKKLPEVRIHTENTRGRDNIYFYLKNAKRVLNL